MRKEVCSMCGENGRVIRQNYRFTEMGLPLVLLDIETIHCPECGNIDPIIPNLDGLMETLAFAVVCKPQSLNGSEVRYLRKYIGKSGRDFSKLIHVDPSTLSNWECNRNPIGEQSDLVIRLVTLALGKGIRERLPEFAERLPGLDEVSAHKKLNLTIDPVTMSYQYA
jgi:DNA-binding transcriptional regulator YiaG